MIAKPPKLCHFDTLPDGSLHKWYDWDLLDSVGVDTCRRLRDMGAWLEEDVMNRQKDTALSIDT